VSCSRQQRAIESGLRDLLILKSTGSGFAGFARDNYTTLAETKDRVLCTSLTASWLYQREPGDFARTNQTILDALLRVFALRYSPSVQATLFQMGEAALAAAPEISRIHLALPNKHCLRVNLAPFGLENDNDLFVPTDEPHGQIEATIAREG
jgi:urate oxidase